MVEDLIRKLFLWTPVSLSVLPVRLSVQVGNHIDILSKKWVAQDAGIGAGVDSYFEYLVKGSIMLQDEELLHMFHGNTQIKKEKPAESLVVSPLHLNVMPCLFPQSTIEPFRTTPDLTTGTCGSRCIKGPSPCLCSSHWRPSGPACR